MAQRLQPILWLHGQGVLCAACAFSTATWTARLAAAHMPGLLHRRAPEWHRGRCGTGCFCTQHEEVAQCEQMHQHKCACQAGGREQRRQQQWHQQHINKAGAASLSYRTGQHTCLGQLPRAGWSSIQSEHSCSSNRPAGSIHNAAPNLTFCLLLPRRLAQIAGQPRLPLHVHTCS